MARPARDVARSDGPPLIAHVIYSLRTGGLENGLVNLINHLPESDYRHTIVCISDFSDFRLRIRRPGVECHALHKPPGKALGTYVDAWRLFRRLRPAVVHTRNIGALPFVVPAVLAGVPVRIHGEHGWDVSDLGGVNRRYRMVRRLLSPLVDEFVALSRDLQRYLVERAGVADARIAQIYNGVDTDAFVPRGPVATAVPEWPFRQGDFVIGTVGRMQAVKDQPTLVRAFVEALRQQPDLRQHARLALVGDGPLRESCAALVREAGIESLCWLPGERNDVPAIMRSFDLFVLPSIAEGISNTILEAMASGVPVVATRVGGNPELVDDGVCGAIVPPSDPPAMAASFIRYAQDRALAVRHGAAAREIVLRRFSLGAMVRAYAGVYDGLLARKLPTFGTP